MMQYVPKPIETASIEISEDLVELTERLAENAHDNWAVLRMSEGWKWGSQRDDGARLHPDLIPYADLPDSEKEYDRRSAMETLKAIIALGFRIGRA